jgi:hypothetical protein
MANDNTSWTFADVLASLEEFVGEDVTSLSVEQARDELKADGIDVDPLIKSVRSTLREAKGRETLAKAHQEREEKLRLQERRSRRPRTRACSRDELMGLIAARQAQNPGGSAVFFRKLNLDEMSDEALEQILDDYGLLDEIDGKEPDGPPES